MNTRIHIFYRISDKGYAKEKPDYINNENCLKNALSAFPCKFVSWKIIADDISCATNSLINDLGLSGSCVPVRIGNGAGTFRIALQHACDLPAEDIVYMLENDYIHQPESLAALREAFTLPVDYVTLYDHPDKYMLPDQGGNLLCLNGGEETTVFKRSRCWWRLTNSTTMTFAARAQTFRQDADLMRDFISEAHPNDFQMFLALRKVGRKLASPIPSMSTHGETKWLADEQRTRHTWSELANMYAGQGGPVHSI